MRICVICEGCYPFVAGGVSSWLHGLIKAMPQHTFVIWAIGAQEKSRGKNAYEMPENVVELRDVYLDEMMASRVKKPRRTRLTPAQKDNLKRFLRCEQPDWEGIFDFFSKPPLENVSFLMSESFLELLEELDVALPSRGTILINAATALVAFGRTAEAMPLYRQALGEK